MASPRRPRPGEGRRSARPHKDHGTVHLPDPLEGLQLAVREKTALPDIQPQLRSTDSTFSPVPGEAPTRSMPSSQAPDCSRCFRTRPVRHDDVPGVGRRPQPRRRPRTSSDSTPASRSSRSSADLRSIHHGPDPMPETPAPAENPSSQAPATPGHRMVRPSRGGGHSRIPPEPLRQHDLRDRKHPRREGPGLVEARPSPWSGFQDVAHMSRTPAATRPMPRRRPGHRDTRAHGRDTGTPGTVLYWRRVDPRKGATARSAAPATTAKVYHLAKDVMKRSVGDFCSGLLHEPESFGQGDSPKGLRNPPRCRSDSPLRRGLARLRCPWGRTLPSGEYPGRRGPHHDTVQGDRSRLHEDRSHGDSPPGGHLGAPFEHRGNVGTDVGRERMALRDRFTASPAPTPRLVEEHHRHGLGVLPTAKAPRVATTKKELVEALPPARFLPTVRST